MVWVSMSSGWSDWHHLPTVPSFKREQSAEGHTEYGLTVLLQNTAKVLPYAHHTTNNHPSPSAQHRLARNAYTQHGRQQQYLQRRQPRRNQWPRIRLSRQRHLADALQAHSSPPSPPLKGRPDTTPFPHALSFSCALTPPLPIHLQQRASSAFATEHQDPEVSEPEHCTGTSSHLSPLPRKGTGPGAGRVW